MLSHLLTGNDSVFYRVMVLFAPQGTFAPEIFYVGILSFPQKSRKKAYTTKGSLAGLCCVALTL